MYYDKSDKEISIGDNVQVLTADKKVIGVIRDMYVRYDAIDSYNTIVSIKTAENNYYNVKPSDVALLSLIDTLEMLEL